MRLKPPKLVRRLMPDLIWEIDDEDGVFLTFDDGPTPGVTEWILSTLDKYDAKATFFVLGKNVEMYPDLYKRILDAGHKVVRFWACWFLGRSLTLPPALASG